MITRVNTDKKNSLLPPSLSVGGWWQGKSSRDGQVNLPISSVPKGEALEINLFQGNLTSSTFLENKMEPSQKSRN